jgi:intein/homing endonuclease
MAIDFSDIAERLPEMSDADKRDLLLKLRRFKNTQGASTDKIKGAPKTDDELWQRIKDEFGYEIPRVSVCEDHNAPFDFMSAYYFERERGILVVGSRESTKCVDSDSLIYDPITGKRNKIKDIIDDNRYNKIITMDKNGNIYPTYIDGKWNTGKKDCLKVSLLSGREIIVTPEHPFMIQDGWFRADEIEIGDTLATPSFLPFHEHKKEIPDSHLTIIAGLLAEGSINKIDIDSKRTISFSSGDDYFVNLMTECSEEVGCEVHYTSGYDYNIVKKYGEFTNPVKKMLLSYSVSCKLAKEKNIPDIIFELGEEQLCEFLSIFWMCDGYITYSEASIGLASKQMILDLQHLLLKIGVQSRVRYGKSSYNGKYFDAWNLSVYSRSIEKFGEKLNLWDYKKINLEDLCAKNRSPREGRPLISSMMLEEFRKLTPIRERGTAKRKNEEASAMLGWKQFGGEGFGVSQLTRVRVKTLQTRRLRALCHAHDIDSKKFSILLNDDLWWDTVTEITKIKDREVFDLTVNNTESFIANDIVVHNTLGVAIINYLFCETKEQCEAASFADIEAQSNKSYSYVKSFSQETNHNGEKVRKSSIDGEPLRKETRWKNGSKLEVLIGTKSGVNSPHPQKVHADEIDLMDEDVFSESRSMASSKKLQDGTLIKAQDIATSTRKSSKGLMQKLIDEAVKAKKEGFKSSWKLFISCIFESAQEVPNCRCAPKDKREDRLKELDQDPCDLCDCNKVVKGEWTEGVPRTLESVCKGRFFRSRGWMSHEDVTGKFLQNTPNVWVAQHECRRPMADGLYLPTWNRDRHTIRGYRPKPEHGLIWQGTDWGGTAFSTVIWVQGPLHQELEISNNIGTSTVLPRGSYIAFKELYEATMGATRLAGKVVRQEIQFKTQFPGFRVKARFADMAGKQARMDWKEHNPPLRTVWYVTREVDPQIECIQALVTDNLLYVDSVGCPNLCDDFESWRQAGGKEVHDESSHGPAAMRYLLINATTLEKRSNSMRQSTNASPSVVDTRETEQRYGALEPVTTGNNGFESENWRKSFQNFGPGVSDDAPWQPS